MVCDLWFVRHDLVHEVTSRPKWPIYPILCWFRVWNRTDAVFCKLHLPCIKKCDQTLYQGQLQGQGQLRSIIMLLWPEVKFSTWPSKVKKYLLRCVLTRETRWCLNYSAIFLSSKVICEKTVNPQIAIFFSLTRPGGVKIWPKKVNSGTIGLRTFQGFVWSLSHSSIPTRGEMAWGGLQPPMCVLGWGNSMCGRGLRGRCSPVFP